MPMKKQYISRNGQIEYEIDEAGEILTYGRDALGNVVAGYDKNTNAVFTVDYKPFGEFAATTGTITGRRFLWVGTWGYRFTPGVPVSHYIRARHLMMRMGMWTSVDPLWPREVGYAYVEGMLMRKIDPFGMQPEPIPPGHITCPPGQKPVYSGPPEGRMDPAFWHCVGVPSTPPPVKHGNCSIMTCHDRRAPWAPWLSAHDAFCFQTANPNKACGADVLPGFYAGGSNPGGCDSYGELRRQNNCAECHSRTVPCVLASLACTCIEDLKSINPALLWFMSGTCYNLGNTLLTCACEKAMELGLPPSSYLPECLWHKPGSTSILRRV